MPGAPPPFQPYRSDPDADPKQNALAFLEWVGDALFRIHALSDANLRYSRAMYEAMYRANAASRPQAMAGVPPRGKRTIDPVVLEIAKSAVRNREAIASFLKIFLK